MFYSVKFRQPIFFIICIVCVVQKLTMNANISRKIANENQKLKKKMSRTNVSIVSQPLLSISYSAYVGMRRDMNATEKKNSFCCCCLRPVYRKS